MYYDTFVYAVFTVTCHHYTKYPNGVDGSWTRVQTYYLLKPFTLLYESCLAHHFVFQYSKNKEKPNVFVILALKITNTIYLSRRGFVSTTNLINP